MTKLSVLLALFATVALAQDPVARVVTCTTTGSANAYVCTPTPAISAYATGQKLKIIANFANTGAATINVSARGAKSIVKAAGGITTALAANDLLLGQVAEMVYDGTNFQMTTGLGNAPSGGTGSPGGSNGQIQVNSSGSFGGIAATSGGGTAVVEITETSPADGDAAVRSGGKYVNARPALAPRAVSTNSDTLSCATAPTGDNGGVVEYSFSGSTAVTVPAAGGSCPVGTVIWLSNKNTVAANTLALSGGITATITANASCRLRIDAGTAWGLACMYKDIQGNTGKVISAGTISGTGSVLCTDASGNATTSACASGGTTSVQAPIGDTISAAGAFTTTAAGFPGNVAQYSRVHVMAGGIGTTSATASPLFNIGVKMTGGATSNVQVCTQQGSTGPGTSRTNLPWSLDCWVTVTSASPSTSGTVIGNGTNTVFSGATSVVAIGVATVSASTIDTTAQQTLSIVETATLVSGQSFTLQYLFVDVK